MNPNVNKWWNRDALWNIAERRFKPVKPTLDPVMVAEGVIAVAMLDMVESGDLSVSVAREWGLNL